MTVTISAQAESDLDEIAHFIAIDNPLRAVSFVEELVMNCRGLADHPQRHPLSGYRDIRRFAYRGYSIYYAVRDANVIIVRILHDTLEHGRYLGD